MGSRLTTVGEEQRRTASDVGGVAGAREDRGPEEQQPPGLRRLREQGELGVAAGSLGSAKWDGMLGLLLGKWEALNGTCGKSVTLVAVVD